MPTTAPISVLHVDEPVENTLSEEETHAYLLALEKDQYAFLTAEQHGVDVELKLLDPEGHLVVRRDSLTGARGAERIHAVAEVAGEFQVQVAALAVEDGVEDPRYALEVQVLRPAEAQDRTRAAAARAFGESAFEEALDNWRAVHDPLEEATTRFRLALGHQRGGNPEDALRELQTAADLFRRLKAPKDVGARRLHSTVLLQLSSLHLERQEPRAAFDAARDAAEILQAVGTTKVLVDAKIRAGQACLWLDRAEDGMRFLEDAIELARNLGYRDKELVARQALAQIHYHRSALDAARTQWQRVEEIAWEMGNPSLAQDAERWQIRISIREDRFEEVRQPLEERLREKLDSTSVRLALLQDATELYLGLGLLDRAQAKIDEGLKLSKQHGDTQYEAMFLHHRGRWHLAREEHEENLENQARARELFEKISDRQGTLSTQYERAQSLYALERYSEAQETLEEAQGLAEDLRQESLSHDLRATYLAARRHYWELYVDTLMRLHEASPEAKFDQLALAAGEKARARGLYEQLVEAEARSRSELNADLRRRRRRAQEELQALELGDAAPETLETQRSRLLETLERLDRRMRSELDLPENPPELSVPGLRYEILRHRRTRMLTYFFGQDRAYAWLVSQDGVDSTPLEASPREIDAIARAWAATLPENHSRARKKRRELGLRLGDLLLGPFRDKLPGGRLVIVPDGALHALPFSALLFPEPAPDGRRRYLVERNEVIQIPSITVLQQLRQPTETKDSQDPSRREVIVFADPAYAASDSSAPAVPSVPSQEPLVRAVRNLGRDTLEALPYTRDEARAIQAAAESQGRSCRLFLGHEARKSVLLDGSLGPVHALHFATHGLIDPSQPELSGIVLSLVDEGGRPIDGYLRLHELYDLRLDARLVVLSACETGLGKQLRGEGLINLTRGFFYAGAPRVVASLWSVDDRSTAELMSRFYRFHLRAGWIPSSALNAAQRTMIDDEEWSDPYHWAAFTYQGDWSPSGILGDDPVGEMASETPEPTEPAGDSEVPFVASLSEEEEDAS